MYTNNHTIETAKVSHLQLKIADTISLVALITQINSICDEVEDKAHTILILQLTGNSLKLNAWPGQVDLHDINRWERAVRRLERLSATCIVVVSGPLGGPSFDLLLIADYRIASSDLELHLPINNGCVWPGMIIHRLVNQVGLGRSRQLLMGTHFLTAQHAFDLGLIDEISDNTFATLGKTITRYSGLSHAEIATRRQLMMEALTTPFEDALGIHLAACDRELRRLNNQISSTHQHEIHNDD